MNKKIYEKSDKKALLEHLYTLTQPLKRTENEGKLAPSEEIMSEMDTDIPEKEKDGIDEITPIRTLPPEELPF